MLLGHGHMGRHHARHLRARGDVDLQIVDPPLGLSGPVDPGADFVVVAAPTSLHAELALPLLEAGIPCLVEKPLAASLEEARALAVHPHLSVGFVERFSPALVPVANVRPRFVQAERLSPFRPRGTDVDVLADLMVHDLDLAGAFLGAGIHEVRASGVGVVSGKVDIAQARLELGAGVAVLSASRVSQRPVRTLRLVEEGVYWSVDLQALTVHRVRWGEGTLDAEPVEVPPGDALARELDAFIRAVRGGGPFPASGAEGLRAMTLVEAVRAELLRPPGPRSGTESAQ